MNRSAAFFFLSLTTFLLFAATISAETSQIRDVPDNDEETLREITKSFYYEFEKPALDGQFGMWSPNSKDDSANREEMTKVFAGWDKMKVEKFQIRSVKIDGDNAAVAITVKVSGFSKKNGKPLGGWLNRDINLTHKFVRENGKWMMMWQISTAEDLTNSLLAANNDTEREQLLNQSRYVVDRDLISTYCSGAFDLAINQLEFEKALENEKFAFRLAESMGEKEAMALIQSYFAFIYERVGDHALSLLADIRTKEIYEEMGNPNGVANAYNSIGGDYSNLGDYRRALEFFEKSVATKTNGKVPVDRPSRLWGNIANTYLELGEYEKADETFQKLLAYSLQNKLAPSIAGAYQGLATISRYRGRDDEALAYYQKAEDLTAGLRDVGMVLQIWNNLAEQYFLMGNYDSALKYADKTTTQAEQAKRTDNVIWAGRVIAAKSLLAKGQRQQAKDELQRAIEVIEGLKQRNLGEDIERQQFFANKTEPYRLMAEIAIADNETVEALKFVERIRSNILVSAIIGMRPHASKIISASELKEEVEITKRLGLANAELARMSQRPKHDDTALKEIEARIDSTRIEYESFRNKLFALHPEIQIQRGDLRPLDKVDISQLIPDTRTAIAEFVQTPAATYVLMITKNLSGKLQLDHFRVGQDGIDSKMRSYISALANGDPGFQSHARELFNVLLKPAQTVLMNKSNLVIIPDGPLWNLPFQALIDENGKYLAEKMAVSYAPSLTALREMRKKAKERPPLKDSELVAFGNPVVAKETSERVQRVFMGEKLEPLPEAERLVNTLAKMYGPTRSKVYTGAAAREETAKSEAPKYRIVQFATHGILNDVSPMYSHLVLAQDEKDPNEDGLLEAWELKDLDLKADMVILSACDTARGKVSAGEGIIGMTWAAFIVGAPTTVASQWKVESTSTTELMIEFHRQLLTGKVSKAEALRRAQLKLMRNPKYKHPGYWAAWVIVGDAS